MLRFRLAPWQAVALYSPIRHLAMYGGVGVGKSFTGSHFAIMHIMDFPEATGLIGANTYDQLTQATLKELFYWLDHYGLEWVIDRMPPEEWNAPRRFKNYGNILSVRHPITKQTVHVLTRVLSKPNPIRGVELTWYWIDETRDTKQEAHDVLLGRMRETDYVRGIVTTTTNGLSWDYQRFVQGSDNELYGSMHVPTLAAVQAGILTFDYYNTMARSYSPMMALQELEAKHVNVSAGRAYYAAGEWNKTKRAPWGDDYPSTDRPLILGCDFNYSPAPHIWMVGQLGPHLHGPKGERWWEYIHWFGEVCRNQTSTPEMTQAVLAQFPDFPLYRFLGDASGQRGSTSNAGQHDYAQISMACQDAGVLSSTEIDWNPDGSGKANPRVKNRVENMNAKFRNALGEVRQTYDPDRCPMFDADLQMVGWKQTSMRGEAKLDNAGDVNRTHASDGAGYAVWKLLPPHQRTRIIGSVPSQMAEFGSQ